MRLHVVAGLGLLGLGVVTACNGQGTGTLNPLNTNDPTPSIYQTPTSGTDPAGPDGDPAKPGGSFPLCQDPPATTTACLSCASSNCAASLARAVAACGAYLQCFSQCECSDDDCVSGCEGDVTSECQTATANVDTCTNTPCASACTDDSSVSFGADAGSVSVGEPGSVGVGSSGSSECGTLSSCCGSLSGAEETECNDVVSASDDSACTETLQELQSAGQCN